MISCQLMCNHNMLFVPGMRGYVLCIAHSMVHMIYLQLIYIMLTLFSYIAVHHVIAHCPRYIVALCSYMAMHNVFSSLSIHIVASIFIWPCTMFLARCLIYMGAFCSYLTMLHPVLYLRTHILTIHACFILFFLHE